MPIFVSAGVYTTILDLSLYVPNLSTTILGIVGTASKGPEDEAVFISNTLSFVTTFGNTNPNFYGPYAALQFLRYGRQLYFVRVAGADAEFADVDIYEGTTQGCLTSDVAGPYTIVDSDNDTLSIAIDADSPATPVAIVLGKGIRTAAEIAAEIQAAFDGAGDSVVVAANVDGTITITSSGVGAASKVDVQAGTANTTLGFTVAIASGADETVAFVQGETVGLDAVNEPYTFPVGSGTLIFTINGTQFSIGLTEGSALTALAIAAEINLDGAFSGAGHTASAVTVGLNTVVKIEATGGGAGSSSTILVTGNNASAILGLPTTLVTGTDDTQATTTGTVSGPFVIGTNNLLQLSIDGGILRPVSFGVSGSLTAAEVVAAINAVIGPTGFNEGEAAVTVDGRVQVCSFTSSSLSTIAASTSGSGTGHFALNSAAGAAIWEAGASGSGTALTRTLEVTALTRGTHGNVLTIAVEAGSQTPNTFRLQVLDGEAVVETWDNLDLAPASDDYVETVINDVSTWITVIDDLGSTNFPAFGTTWLLTGGDDGLDLITDADYIGTITPSGKTGLQLFANAEELDLNLIMAPGVSSAAVINEMLLISSIRGDMMALVDPPFGLSPQQVVDWHNGVGAYSDHQAFNSLYGALYWPWLEIFDAVNAVKVFVPPSGLLSGVYAFTDFTTETWFAPAGLNRGHLLQPLRLERSPDLGERDLLYGNRNAVNPIVNFPKDGINVWGQRSLQRKPSALDRVNVVRLVLFLRKVIATAVRFLVFEPNDPVTWSTFVNLVEPYMESVRQRRGVTDFRVICDETTNPPDAIDRNEMHGVVALKPTKAAEFIQVKFAIVNQGARFEDLTF